MAANIVELRRVVHIQGKTTGVKEATTDLKRMDAAYAGVSVQAEKVTRSTLSEERALRALQTRLDPTFRATEKLAAAERTLTAAQAQGLITLARKNELMALAAAQTDRAAVATGRLAGAMRLVAGLGIGVGVAGAYGLARGIGEAISQADQLTELSVKVGVGVRDLQAFGYAARQSGVDFEQFVDALSYFNKQVGEASRGGGDLLKILQANGVAIRDQAGQLRPTADLFQDYANLVQDAGSAQDRTTLVTKAFGRSADELVVALSGGSSELRTLAAEAIRTGQVLDEQLVKNTSDIADRWENFTTRLTVAFQTFVLGVVEGFEQLGEARDATMQETAADLEALSRDMNAASYVREAAAREASKLRAQNNTNVTGFGGVPDATIISFQDYKSAVDEATKSVTKLPPKLDDVAKATTNIITPRTRESGLVGLREQFERVEKSASSFTETLVSGLIQGQGIVGSLSSALGGLSSNFGNLASGFLNKIGGGGIVGSILGGLGGGIVSSLVGGIGSLIDSIFGDNGEEERAKREERRLRREEKRQDEKDRLLRREERILDRQEQRRGYADRVFMAGLDTSTLEGQLAGFDREALRERQDLAASIKNADKRARMMARLEEALAAERLAIVQDYSARVLAEQQAAAATLLAEQKAAAAELVASARDALQKAYEAEANARRETIDGLQTTITGLKQFTSSIRALKDQLILDRGLSPLDPAGRLAEARRQFETATPDTLAASAQAYLTEAKDFFASSPEYAAIFDQVQATLDQQLAGAEAQITTAERQLSVAEKQLTALEATVNAELGTTQAVMSVAAAIQALHAALAGQAAVGMASGGIVGNGTFGVDSVVARYAGGGTIGLAGGEYVMPAAQTRAHLPQLEAMRSGSANDNSRILVMGFGDLSRLLSALVEGQQRNTTELKRLQVAVERPERPKLKAAG